jgi:hypothetical protein
MDFGTKEQKKGIKEKPLAQKRELKKVIQLIWNLIQKRELKKRIDRRLARKGN